MFNPIIREEFAHTINGVEGRMFAVTMRENEAPGAFCSQKWGASREFHENGKRYVLSVDMRFDDNCRNGHNTFAITGEVFDPSIKRSRYNDGIVACGCVHDEIEKVFPELRDFIKWHLTSSDGPMHYVANAVYLAGDRDCWGLRKGERAPLRTRNGATMWDLVAVTGGPHGVGVAFSKHAYGEYIGADTVPLFILQEHYTGENPPATPHLRWVVSERVGEGKERELDAARRAAIWPEATDEELMQDPEALRAQLEARLPALQEAFKSAMLGAGFLWERESSEVIA